jgi:hypothetical protein
MQIIVKNYEHFNRSFGNWDTPKGKYIKSKAHYLDELAKSGMKQYDEFGQVEEPKRKEYELSKKGREIIQAAKNSKDKNGKVKLSDKTIDAMKEMGAINKKVPSYMKLPSHYKNGGFK